MACKGSGVRIPSAPPTKQKTPPGVFSFVKWAPRIREERTALDYSPAKTSEEKLRSERRSPDFMLIRRICILKLGTRAERFNEEGFCEATIQEPQRIPQLPDVTQGVASLEWISGIDFPSR